MLSYFCIERDSVYKKVHILISAHLQISVVELSINNFMEGQAMVKTNLFHSTNAHKIVAEMGRFSLLEYERDMSITPQTANIAFLLHKWTYEKNKS